MSEASQSNTPSTATVKLSEIKIDSGLYPRVKGHDPELVQHYARDMGYVAIAERYFQKKCLPDEVVHHIDGDHWNNDPENLVIMKRSQHSRLHAGLMGALDNWRDRINGGLCNTCFYVSLFDSMKIESREDISDELSSFLLGIWISDKAKPVPQEIDARELLASLYKTGISWKTEHDHDCYAMRNMHIVSGRQS